MTITKPDSCKGCPFYSKGEYYVPDHITPGSTVMLIAQNPGADEIDGHALVKRHWIGNGKYHDEFTQVRPQPLIGAVGQMLNTKFLPLSTLRRGDISTGNAIRCRPGTALGLAADELPTVTSKMHLETSKTDIVTAIRHCARVHLKIPASVTAVVAMGGIALYQLTGHTDITNWRGYALRTDRQLVSQSRTVDISAYHDLTQPHYADTLDIFATMHISALFKGMNKRYYGAVLHDFYKLGQLIKGQWPLGLPTWSDIPPARWPLYSSFDTEYNPDTNELIRWSLCDAANKLYCVESEDTPDHITIMPNSTVLTQNAIADINHLATIVDFSRVKIEDLMLAHATLHTGEPHSLNFINSMYGAFNRYKHLIHEDDQAQLYSALDAFEPLHIWRTYILPAFRKDRESYNVYKRFMLPLIPIINDAQQRGVRLNGQRLEEIQSLYEARLNDIRVESREMTGDSSFNIGGSKQMKELLYENAAGD